MESRVKVRFTVYDTRHLMMKNIQTVYDTRHLMMKNIQTVYDTRHLMMKNIQTVYDTRHLMMKNIQGKVERTRKAENRGVTFLAPGETHRALF